MATLRDIKLRIKGVKSTQKITSAMKMVATAKLKRAQNAIESARPYFMKLENTISDVIASISDDYSHPLLGQREEVKSVAFIVVSSDKGLAGSFNNNLFKSFQEYLQGDFKKEFPEATVRTIPVGRKAVDYFRKNNFDNIRSFPGVFNNLSFDISKSIINTVVDDYVEGKIDRVYVYYNQFMNVMVQLPTRKMIIPLEHDLSGDQEASVDYIYEPDKKQLLDVLIPKLIDIQLWRALLESNAAENAARMMAMDSATTNAGELIENLELQYNKARQAAITTEMLEIVSGANALAGR